MSPGDHERAAPLVSTRWNPTPEQLQALEEMYRRGIRTPPGEQIQHIATVWENRREERFLLVSKPQGEREAEETSSARRQKNQYPPANYFIIH